MNKQELKDRWVSILRAKACEYEHPTRGTGETITNPDIDDICNEMEAFFCGIAIDK